MCPCGHVPSGSTAQPSVAFATPSNIQRSNVLRTGRFLVATCFSPCFLWHLGHSISATRLMDYPSHSGKPLASPPLLLSRDLSLCATYHSDRKSQLCKDLALT